MKSLALIALFLPVLVNAQYGDSSPTSTLTDSDGHQNVIVIVSDGNVHCGLTKQLNKRQCQWRILCCSYFR
jgi:hypothetical protein